MDDNVHIIGGPKATQVTLEVPATFATRLFFINHQGEFTTVEFGLPPGVYPHSDWLPKLIEEVYRNSLKTLKISTKDLSWRKCSPAEFVRATAGGQPVVASPKWAEPYTAKLELPEVPEVEKVDEDINKS